jgi:hypothetical protein
MATNSWRWASRNSRRSAESRLEKLKIITNEFKEELKALNSVGLVSERTIPTERPPLVGEVSADRGVSRSQRGGCPTFIISVV